MPKPIHAKPTANDTKSHVTILIKEPNKPIIRPILYAFFLPTLSETIPPINAPSADPKALQPNAPKTPLP